MDYYARLLELLALLPPERQADMIRGLELLLEASEQPLPAPKEETPSAPAEDVTQAE